MSKIISPTLCSQIQEATVMDERARSKLSLLQIILAGQSRHVHTLNTIKSLYTSLSTRKLEHHLTAEEMSSLIQLFGFASIPDSPQSAFVNGPIASRLHGQGSFWKFVLRIAQDKIRVHKHLTDSDRFWVMRVCPASAYQMKYIDSSQPRLPRKASECYDKIWNPICNTELHASYLRALASSKDGLQVEVAMSKLCEALRRHLIVPHQIQALFWRLVLEHHTRLSWETKEQILSALTSRVEAVASIFSRINTHGHPIDNDVLSTRTLQKSLTVTIFPPPCATPHLTTPLWPTDQLRSFFLSSTALHIKWDLCLVLASALADQPLEESSKPTLLTPPIYSDWCIMCLLSSTETALTVESRCSPTRLADIKQLTRSLWHTWLSECHQRPQYISRTIIAAFLRVSRRTKDPHLIEGCHHYVLDHNLLSIEDANQPSVKAIQVEIIVSSALTAGSCYWQDTLRAPCNTVSMPSKYSQKLANAAIYRLLGWDVNAAREVYHFCVSHCIKVSSGVIHALAVTLARSGHSPATLPLLCDDRFSTSQKERLWTTIISPCMHLKIKPVQFGVAVAIGDVLERLYKADNLPPLRIRGHIQYALTVIAPTTAVDIVASIVARAPKYFQQSFYYRMFCALVNQGHHPSCLQLIDIMSCNNIFHDHYARFIALRLSRANTYRIARRACFSDLRQVPRQARVAERLIRVSYWSPRSIKSLTLLPFLKGQEGVDNSTSIRLALILLTRARRLHAAKTLFAQVHSRFSTPLRTHLGNILLCGVSLQSSSASTKRRSLRSTRIVRQILSLIHTLKEQYGFVQDGVTVNILLAAMLRCRKDMDVTKARDLFSQILTKKDILFSSAISSQAVGPLGGDGRAGPASFSRHLKPMYKQFIKAFHLRGDGSSARAIIGKLKAEQDTQQMRMARWNQLRCQGRRGVHRITVV